MSSKGYLTPVRSGRREVRDASLQLYRMYKASSQQNLFSSAVCWTYGLSCMWSFPALSLSLLTISMVSESSTQEFRISLVVDGHSPDPQHAPQSSRPISLWLVKVVSPPSSALPTQKTSKKPQVRVSWSLIERAACLSALFIVAGIPHPCFRHGNWPVSLSELWAQEMDEQVNNLWKV